MVTAGNVETVDLWAPYEGTRSLDLNGVLPGQIQQNLSGFVVGATYQLSFWMGGNYFSGGNSQSARAGVGATSGLFTHTLGLGDTRFDFTWKEMTLDFTAEAEGLALIFTQVTDRPAAGAALDDVSIARLDGPSPIPLPAGVWLLAAGLGGLGFLRRCTG